MIDQKMLGTKTSDKDYGIQNPVVMYPHPSTKSCAEKLGIFALGVMTGAIALGVTAAVVENLDKIPSNLSDVMAINKNT